jgi:hypothetical protein
MANKRDPNCADKNVDQRTSDASVEVDLSSSPKQQTRQFTDDHIESMDASQKGSTCSKGVDYNDSSSYCTAGDENKSLPSSPRPSLAPETSSHSTASDIACNLFELTTPSVENPVQQIAVVNGFDPLSSIVNGTVMVPVLVATPSINEQEVKRFDPLATPKRSGSKQVSNAGNLSAYSEFNGGQQGSAYSVPQIDVSNGMISAAMSYPPTNVSMASIMSHPPPSQQPSTNLPANHLTAAHPPMIDPFDEIALRHGGGSQSGGNG